jgi:hypothetical protein
MKLPDTMKVCVTKSEEDNWYKVGDVYEVLVSTKYHAGGEYHPIINEVCEFCNYGIGVDDFEVIPDKSVKPHKHSALIKAWADGASVQVRVKECYPWEDDQNPHWGCEFYRVKPAVEYPKSGMTENDFKVIHCTRGDTYRNIANDAVRLFITSGQMDFYIKEQAV